MLLETPGMVMKPLANHHCHTPHPVFGKAVTAFALVILAPAETTFVFVATSSAKSAAVPASTALAAKLDSDGADLIATAALAGPSSHARILAKESVTNLQSSSEESHWRASQMTRTSVGYLPTSYRPCLPAHRTLCLFLPTRKTTRSSWHKMQNSFGLKIFQQFQLSEQSSIHLEAEL